ncbi:hypothetical protein [Edaphobacter aggregans]|jgi:hypothetical protein|nr:hypothetical protein [Edaphobacter aggregans]
MTPGADGFSKDDAPGKTVGTRLEVALEIGYRMFESAYRIYFV